MRVVKDGRKHVSPLPKSVAVYQTRELASILPWLTQNVAFRTSFNSKTERYEVDPVIEAAVGQLLLLEISLCIRKNKDKTLVPLSTDSEFIQIWNFHGPRNNWQGITVS